MCGSCMICKTTRWRCTIIFGQEGTEQVTADLMKELKRLQVQYDDPILKEFPIGE